MTAVISINGNDFDAYASVADADVYFAGRIDSSAWDSANVTQKSKALVNSTRLLELQTYKGELTDDTTPQPLQWPRSGIVDRRGIAVPDDTIPADVLTAYYELAQALLANPSLGNTANQNQNTKRVRAGDVETEFFTPNLNAPRFPNQVHEPLRFYLGSAAQFVPFASGTEGTSSFLQPSNDKYGLNEGYP